MSPRLTMDLSNSALGTCLLEDALSIIINKQIGLDRQDSLNSWAGAQMSVPLI